MRNCAAARNAILTELADEGGRLQVWLPATPHLKTRDTVVITFVSVSVFLLSSVVFFFFLSCLLQMFSSCWEIVFHLEPAIVFKRLIQMHKEAQGLVFAFKQ